MTEKLIFSATGAPNEYEIKKYGLGLGGKKIEILAEDAKTAEKYFEWLDKKRAGD
jgi:hypothetical protein